jgi:hypothetical protein
MIIISADKAFANDHHHGHFDKVYTVDSSGDSLKDTEFSLDEKPWLLIRENDIADNHPASIWFAPNGDEFSSTEIFTFKHKDNKVWLSFTDSFWASLTDKTGKWQVSAFEKDHCGKSFIGKTCFFVTPEPISSALFLLGGGALALRSYRKRTVKKA